MLKSSNTKSAKSRKDRIKVGDDSRNEHDGRARLDSKDDIDDGEVDDNEVEDNEVVEEKNYQNT